MTNQAFINQLQFSGQLTTLSDRLEILIKLKSFQQFYNVIIAGAHKFLYMYMYLYIIVNQDTLTCPNGVHCPQLRGSNLDSIKWIFRSTVKDAKIQYKYQHIHVHVHVHTREIN